MILARTVLGSSVVTASSLRLGVVVRSAVMGLPFKVVRVWLPKTWSTAYRSNRREVGGDV